MSQIPLLDDKEDEIRASLSLQEIKIALNFLKKRFRDYSIKQIIQSLNQYLISKDQQFIRSSIGASNIPYTVRNPSISLERLRQSPFLHHKHLPLCHQERAQKSQQIKLVAKLYCESGIKYSLAQYFFPQITHKEYKADLQTITVQTLNNIEKFLRYQCNVQIQQLSRIQKFSAREKLINIRDWMGKAHPEHLNTYFMFIQRYYLNQNIEIEYKQAFQLYKVILQSVKGPQVTLNQPNQPRNRSLRQQLNLAESQSKSLSKQQEKALIILFKKLLSIQKVSDALCQKYGYEIKFSNHSVKNILKKILKSSLKKLAQTAKIYQKNTKLFFGYGQDDIKVLFEYQNSLQTKIELLDFYMLKKITILKLKQFVKKINNFYSNQLNQNLDIYQQIPDNQVELPELIRQGRQKTTLIPIQLIEIQQNFDEDQKKQYEPYGKQKITSKQKRKKNWIQIVELDSQSEEQEQNNQNIDKDNQQTNVQAMVPIQGKIPYNYNKKQQVNRHQTTQQQAVEDKTKKQKKQKQQKKQAESLILLTQPSASIKQNKKQMIQLKKLQKLSYKQNLNKTMNDQVNISLDTVVSAPVKSNLKPIQIKNNRIKFRFADDEQIEQIVLQNRK